MLKSSRDSSPDVVVDLTPPTSSRQYRTGITPSFIVTETIPYRSMSHPYSVTVVSESLPVPVTDEDFVLQDQGSAV